MAEFSTPFRNGGPTIAILGSFGVTPSALFINQAGDWSMIVSNRSAAQDAYLGYGATSAAAVSNVVPVTGLNPSNNSQNVNSVPFRTVQSFTFSGPTFFAVVVPATNAILDLTPGEGS